MPEAKVAGLKLPKMDQKTWLIIGGVAAVVAAYAALRRPAQPAPAASAGSAYAPYAPAVIASTPAPMGMASTGYPGMSDSALYAGLALAARGMDAGAAMANRSLDIVSKSNDLLGRVVDFQTQAIAQVTVQQTRSLADLTQAMAQWAGGQQLAPTRTLPAIGGDPGFSLVPVAPARRGGIAVPTPTPPPNTPTPGPITQLSTDVLVMRGAQVYGAAPKGAFVEYIGGVPISLSDAALSRGGIPTIQGKPTQSGTGMTAPTSSQVAGLRSIRDWM